MEIIVTKSGQKKMPLPSIVCCLGDFKISPDAEDLIADAIASVFNCPWPGEDREAQAIRAEAGAMAAVLAAATPMHPPI